MNRRRLLTLFVGFTLTLTAVAQETATRGRKFKASPPTVRVEVSVVRANSGKPIENASVIFHQMEGARDKGNMELKTNEDGKTVIDVLELGSTVRFQVIAAGFQTYGEDIKMDKPNISLEVKLSRPVKQYSDYKDQPAPTPAAAPVQTPNQVQPK